MVVNNYLLKLANSLILSYEDKNNIENAIAKLEDIIENNLKDAKDYFCFGSFTRETSLPLHIDRNSDVDYLIVFNKPTNKYELLKTIVNFVEENFTQKQIVQLNPTCIVLINGVRFELIPAYRDEKYFINYKIPFEEKENIEWIPSIPNDLNEQLLMLNSKHNSLILPLIRLIKFWNVLHGYLYRPYLLENRIVNLDFPLYENLSDYLNFTVENLMTDDLDDGAIRLVNELKDTLRQIHEEIDEEVAVFYLSKILPFIE